MSDVELIQRRNDSVVVLAKSDKGRHWIIENIILEDGFDVDHFECVFIKADKDDIEDYIRRIKEAGLDVEVS